MPETGENEGGGNAKPSHRDTGGPTAYGKMRLSIFRIWKVLLCPHPGIQRIPQGIPQ